MPIHAGGPRLYRSIKFHHLAKTSGSARASNVSLNLTPFVDMMTILVTFLLMVFASDGALLAAAKNLTLPVADRQAALVMAPVVMVSESEITVVIPDPAQAMPRTKTVAMVQSLLENPPPTLKIDALHEELKPAAEAIHNDLETLKAMQNGGKGFTKDQVVACVRESEGQPPLVKAKQVITCPDGLAIVQADTNTDARIINMVVTTMRQAGFAKILFAVKFSPGGAK